MSDRSFAWCTPPEPAAIAIVRLRHRHSVGGYLDRAAPEAGRARFARLRTRDGAIVDEVVATRLAPEAIELSTHGGAGIRAAVTACLIGHGFAESADAAEGDARWSALARAPSPAAVRWLLVHGLDDPPFAREFLVRAPIVLITGPVNAGKSTLLNAWCGRERALVSAIPGTTRDLVAAETTIGGWRVRLLDSAGMRPTADPLEAAGQDLVAQARGWADVVLSLGPADPGADGAPQPAKGRDLEVIGKADLLTTSPEAGRLAWSSVGVAGQSPAQLLERLGGAVLARLALPGAPRS